MSGREEGNRHPGRKKSICKGIGCERTGLFRESGFPEDGVTG